MNKLFTFDVSLKDLMNLGERAKEVENLDLIFRTLHHFWYNLKDKNQQKRREETTRVGSVDVFLDEDKNLHIDFVTRFSFASLPTMLEVLQKLKAP